MYRLLPDFLDALLGLFIAIGQNWKLVGGGFILFIAFVYIAKLLIILLRGGLD